MTWSTKYILTLSLKLSFENWETLLKFLIWIHLSNESALIHITKNGKQTLISYQAKYVLQWERFLWILNEQYLVKGTKYVASQFLQSYGVCFTETTLERLSKTLMAADVNIPSSFSGYRSNGAACIFFTSICNYLPTNRNTFSLLEMIKSGHVNYWCLE